VDFRLSSKYPDIDYVNFTAISKDLNDKNEPLTSSNIINSLDFLNFGPSNQPVNSIGLKGVVAFNCSDSFAGKAVVTVQLNVLNKGLPQSVSYTVVKECAAGGKDACQSCQFCINDNTCTCEVDSLGTSCVRKVRGNVKNVFVNEVKLVSYNVNGLGVNGEPADQISSRMSVIADRMLEVDPAVILMQEVWTDAQRSLLISKYQQTHPYIISKSYYNGPSEDSGLFVASKVPFIDYVFESFTSSIAEDALKDKGFTILTLDFSGFVLILANTHMQSTGGSLAPKARLDQMQQLMSAMQRKIIKAQNTFDKNVVGAAATGDFNVRYDTSPLSEYSNFTSKINNARNVLLEMGVTKPTFGSENSFINCTREVLNRYVCL
jgi:exonuclease III